MTWMLASLVPNWDRLGGWNRQRLRGGGGEGACDAPHGRLARAGCGHAVRGLHIQDCGCFPHMFMAAVEVGAAAAANSVLR